MSEEIKKKLDELAAHRQQITDAFEKSIQENKHYAAKLVAELNGIKVGDIIEIDHGKKKAIIRKIEANYYSLPRYLTRPSLIISFLKKDGTPRADRNRIWGDWSKVND